MMDRNDALTALGLSEENLQGLSENEQQALFRKTFLWKSYFCFYENSLRDESIDPEEYTKLTEAYKSLKKYKIILTDAFNSRVEDDVRDMPVKAVVNWYDKEIIEKKYSELLEEFLGISSAPEKEEFISQNKDYIRMARSLEKYSQSTGVEQIKASYEQLQQFVGSLTLQLTREWRMLIISLLGEEYLDDFTYRQALASGNLWPVLATRKLLSPVKLAIAAINSIFLLINDTTDFYFKKLWLDSIRQFKEVEQAYAQGTLNIKSVFFVVTAISLCLGLIVALPYVVPIQYLLVFACSLFIDILNHIANPINKIIRPIENLTGVPAFGVGLGLSLLVVSAGYLLSATALPGTMALLTYSVASLQLLNLCLMLATATKASKLDSENGMMWFAATGFIGVPIIIRLVEFLTFPAMPPMPYYRSVYMFLAVLHINLASCLFYKYGILNDIKKYFSEWSEMALLPTKPVPEEAVKACNTAQLSSRFFNTDPNAKAVSIEKRTCLQNVFGIFSTTPDKSKSAQPTVDGNLGLSAV